MEKNYYVYEHIRKDNGTCFYVGKGKNNRAYHTSRNPHHDGIANKYGMDVRIVKEGLTEQEAFDLEKAVILKYILLDGYGIDIPDMNFGADDATHWLTNATLGGDGTSKPHTEEWKRNHSLAMQGENNPMYGVNVYEHMTPEQIEIIKKKISAASSGENNPMYGISPKDRMDEQTYKIWLEKRHNREQSGDKNPNWGNKTLHNKLVDRPDLRIEYYSRPGSNNGRARAVYAYDADWNFLKEFEYIGECCEWMKTTYNIKSKIDSMRSHVSQSAKSGKPYRNIHFSFEKL